MDDRHVQKRQYNKDESVLKPSEYRGIPGRSKREERDNRR